MPTTSYWLEEHADPLPRRPASGPADVIVIGGGVTGCSCALTLAARGLRVRVHEARVVAGGASGRNGGFALRGGAGPYDRARARLGPDAARVLWELTERTLERLADLAGDAFRRVGSIRLAVDEAERAALEREHAALQEDGFAVGRIHELEPPLDRLFQGAILNPDDGAIQPARWVRRRARCAADAGAEIVEGSRIRVEDADAPAVVVAVDGAISEALPELREVVWPVRGQVLVTEPLPVRLFPRPHYARYGFDYWQQLPDGRLIVGGRRDASLDSENTAVEETTPLVQKRLESLVDELLGRLPRITHRWVVCGARRRTRSRSSDVYRAVQAHGSPEATPATATCSGSPAATWFARAILGEQPAELALVDPARFF